MVFSCIMVYQRAAGGGRIYGETEKAKARQGRSYRARGERGGSYIVPSSVSQSQLAAKKASEVELTEEQKQDVIKAASSKTFQVGGKTFAIFAPTKFQPQPKGVPPGKYNISIKPQTKRLSLGGGSSEPSKLGIGRAEKYLEKNPDVKAYIFKEGDTEFTVRRGETKSFSGSGAVMMPGGLPQDVRRDMVGGMPSATVDRISKDVTINKDVLQPIGTTMKPEEFMLPESTPGFPTREYVITKARGGVEYAHGKLKPGTIGYTVGSFFTGAAERGVDIGEMVIHPVRTTKGLGGFGYQLVTKPMQTGGLIGESVEKELSAGGLTPAGHLAGDIIGTTLVFKGASLVNPLTAEKTVLNVGTKAVPVEKTIVSGGVKFGSRGKTLFSYNPGSGFRFGTANIQAELGALKPGVDIPISGRLTTELFEKNLVKLQDKAPIDVLARRSRAIPTIRNIIAETQGKIPTYQGEVPKTTLRLTDRELKVFYATTEQERLTVFGSLSRKRRISPEVAEITPKDVDLRLNQYQQSAPIVQETLSGLGKSSGAKFREDLLKPGVIEKRIRGKYEKVGEFKGGDIPEEELVPERVLGYVKEGKPEVQRNIRFTKLDEELRGVAQGVARVQKRGGYVDVYPVPKRVKDIQSLSAAGEQYLGKGNVNLQDFRKLYNVKPGKAEISTPSGGRPSSSYVNSLFGKSPSRIVSGLALSSSASFVSRTSPSSSFSASASKSFSKSLSTSTSLSKSLSSSKSTSFSRSVSASYSRSASISRSISKSVSKSLSKSASASSSSSISASRSVPSFFGFSKPIYPDQGKGKTISPKIIYPKYAYSPSFSIFAQASIFGGKKVRTPKLAKKLRFSGFEVRGYL